jgi:drug/metabolite transporter (DMT)-like permease
MPAAALALFAGLASAISFGAGDFAGGLATRRISGLAVTAGAQLVGFAILLLVVGATRPAAPEPLSLVLGLAAGASGAIGVAALYQALALGAMGLLASISGAGAVTIPLVVSITLLGGRISPIQGAGVACAAAAVLAAGGASRGSTSRTALGLALLAAAGFGFWYLLLDQAAALGTGPWTLLTSRFAGAALMSIVAAARGELLNARRSWRLVLASGLCDVGGNALYIVARGGLQVSLAAALSGIYPLFTMLLARLVLNERLPRLGHAGVGLALLAIVLIALGGPGSSA